MRKLFLVCLFLSIILFSSTQVFAYTEKALLLYDDPTGNSAYLAHQRTLGTLLGHFDLAYDQKTLNEYTVGDINNYKVTFYVGNSTTASLPIDFQYDVLRAQRPLVWINLNLNKFNRSTAKSFEKMYGIRSSGMMSGASYNKVQYSGRTYNRQQASIAKLSILDFAKVKVIATAVNGRKKIPYMVRSGLLYYIADDPMELWYEDQTYIIFAELLHEQTQISHNVNHRALVRIEDVNAESDPAKLRALADYFASENVPFSVGVIPRFTDPLGRTGPARTIDINEKPELIDALKYIESKGGVIIMHGFTHQYGTAQNPYNGVTGDDAEFYIVQFDGSGNWREISPVPEDSVEWVQARLDAGRQIFAKAGLSVPTIFETPHYFSSELDLQVFSDNFSAIYQRFNDAYFPYVINKSVYGGKIIPENLGFISPGLGLTPEVIIDRADKNMIVSDGVASFFFHPEQDINNLKTAVSGIKGLGYTFVSPNSL